MLPLLGRVLVALIFLVSAFGKLSAPAGTIGYIGSVGIPMPTLAYALALVTELVGGAILALGYRTRLVAAALAAFSVVSAVFFHHALGDQNQMFHFLKNLAMAGGLLQFVAHGAGAYGANRRNTWSCPLITGL
ncbi:DoxX family protein [Paucibacter sp. R3-3]|uniref:DoxX family protein n=1 Tax=Roseateles agri TaxID=3098619 RepID=A0ABU5DKS2_9BURK|nr:DoxX family protein [Paucibacter sp. R3-3]MDY0746906.1 DoxX family protein [Paucibacter sp. R3-3]